MANHGKNTTSATQSIVLCFLKYDKLYSIRLLLCVLSVAAQNRHNNNFIESHS